VRVCIWQAKLSLEKMKQQLEQHNSELDAELKQVSSSRQESDRKRKQVEQQLQEVSLRLAELEKTRGDLGDKAAKYQVRSCFLLSICCFSYMMLYDNDADLHTLCTLHTLSELKGKL